MKLRTRMTIILLVLLVCAVGLNAVWTGHIQGVRAEGEMLEKARILTAELDAVWEFMDMNQDRIDTDADGSYNFKGLYCAITGKSVAKILERDTDYVVRYTSPTPRKKASKVDEFEAAAVEVFETTDQREYYDRVEYDGEEVFRYVTPIYLEESCLDCHGGPAGEIDVTGYAKEGMEVGELIGVTSVIMPVEIYLEGIREGIEGQTVFFALVIGVVVLIMGVTVTRTFARPLELLGDAAEQIENGNFDVDIERIGSGEIRDLSGKLGSMARQLQELYSDLEGKVELRTSQLEQANALLESQRMQLAEANEELQVENRYKSEFLAIVSHDLRTPLTAILAYTDIWLASSSDRDEHEVSSVREIKENGQVLLQMVNNILAMARVEAGRAELSVEPFDMMDLIGLVERSMSFIAERRGVSLVTLVHRDVPIIQADWDKIRRIVENLVGNALKFTSRGGSVRIEVGYDAAPDEVVITVTDTGVGIAEEDLPYVFDRFMQGGMSRKRRYKGSGLGLAVVKEMAELHGGGVEVQSELGKGSEFVVRIPARSGEGE